MIYEHLAVGDVASYFGHDDPETFDLRLLGLDEEEQDITQMDFPGQDPEHHTTVFFVGIQNRKKLRGRKWPSR